MFNKYSVSFKNSYRLLRTSTHKFEVGQLVLIHEDNLPPAQWAIGRIIQLIPSKDDLIRSVVVLLPESKRRKTKTLVLPVQKLKLLPIAPEPTQQKQSEQFNDDIEKSKSHDVQI